MISSAEIKRIAGTRKVDPMIVERDYILGCYLKFLALHHDVRNNWIFKGGTCLRKCYFEGYRFSEDLDFTIKKFVSNSTLMEILLATSREMQSKTGVRFDVKEPIVEMVEDDYGKESVECKAYFRGPLGFRGSAPAIRIHLNRDEIIVFPVKSLSINHAYSDREELPQSQLQAYSLEEILAEKLRAFSGQRRFAIARDIYDIFHLVSKGANAETALLFMKEKCSIKKIDCHDINLDSIQQRKEEFELNWKRNLMYLVPNDLEISFQEAWDLSFSLLERAVKN